MNFVYILLIVLSVIGMVLLVALSDIIGTNSNRYKYDAAISIAISIAIFITVFLGFSFICKLIEEHQSNDKVYEQKVNAVNKANKELQEFFKDHPEFLVEDTNEED